jgi:predicted alpha/beta-fold hydrolase
MIEIDSSSQFVNMYVMRYKNKTINFKFTKAEENNKPILFILHGHGHSGGPSNFQSPNWNVVCPMDQFGVDKQGSWFLGEDGDLFWIEAMAKLISWIRNESGTGRLYFWGSSMGGYAGIVHGRLNNATAVYANVPQTLLLSSQYSKNGMDKYFAPIFGNALEENKHYNDLNQFFTSRTRTKYFLCFNQLEGGNYFEEQGIKFISHLNKLKQKFYLEVRPTAAHAKNHGLSESINLFKKYAND